MASNKSLNLWAERAPLSIFIPLVALAALFLAPAAHAGDGRIEINQARALAGGVSPSDGAGFPVSLEGNQSYVLTGDLDAGPSTALTWSGPLGTVDNVSINLNGFAIRGDGSGVTTGINATGGNVEIKDGTVRDFGGRGIHLQTSGRYVLRNLRVMDNGGRGIDTNAAAVITDCLVQSNGDTGIHASSGAYIARNRVDGNGGSGITASSRSFVESNLISHSSSTNAALELNVSGTSPASGYRNNLIGNGSGGGTVSGGQDMGGNLCNGVTTCP